MHIYAYSHCCLAENYPYFKITFIAHSGGTEISIPHTNGRRSIITAVIKIVPIMFNYIPVLQWKALMGIIIIFEAVLFMHIESNLCFFDIIMFI